MTKKNTARKKTFHKNSASRVKFLRAQGKPVAAASPARAPALPETPDELWKALMQRARDAALKPKEKPKQLSKKKDAGKKDAKAQKPKDKAPPVAAKAPATYNKAFAVPRPAHGKSEAPKPAASRVKPSFAKTAAASPKTQNSERIAKALARLGVASRRDIERMIAEGRVAVDGAVITHPAFFVEPRHRITVDGKPVGAKETTRMWRYFKPEGLVTTAHDPEGRPTVFSHLPKTLPRVISVGRLDIASEGLLLLTNDGELARFLEQPQQEMLRRYRVRVHCGSKGMNDKALQKLASGITIEGVAYKGIQAKVEQVTGHNAWLGIELREGKNREIRRVMEHLGYPVSRLLRVGFGPFQLGKLEKGMIEEIPQRSLRDQLPGFFK